MSIAKMISFIYVKNILSFEINILSFINKII
jgi:hypothetical protein